MANYLLNGGGNSTACSTSVYTDCIPEVVEVALTTLTTAGAIAANSNTVLAPTGTTAAVFTLPVTTVIGTGVMLRWMDGVTPIQVTGGNPATTVVLDLPANTGQGAAYLRWNGRRWDVVHRTQQAYACPGDARP